MAQAPENSGLRLVPLGGLGEFGLNALVLEWGGHLLLIDAGMMFAGPEMPGVDSIVPDFAYLAERRDQLRGILLTHGHEDHIGALTFALEAAPAPVYGSRLTLGLASRRLKERGIRAEFRTMSPGTPSDIGPFRVHPIRVAHSVLDSLALAIETPSGTVLASGDFKMDASAPENERTDVASLAEWGERGVLALLSDSTNVEHRGRTEGEESLVPTFQEILARARGRVLVSCFATAIPRMQRVAELASRAGREVSFLGRRMIENAEVAMDLGLLRIPRSSLLAQSSPPESGLVFVAGSQGEPLSALSMLSVGAHKDMSVGKGDTVVLSARVIPGNERSVSRMMSNFCRRGCEVLHPGNAKVHVSGHGSRDDLVELLSLVKPRYLVPVHGEYRMLSQHKRLAVEAGLREDQVLVAEDGDVLALDQKAALKKDPVPAGRRLLEDPSAEGVEDMVLRDRRHLSASGIVVPIVVVDRQTRRVESPPEIVTRGFVDSGERASLLEEAGRLVVETLESRPDERDPLVARERVRAELRRFFKKRTKRRPMVIPVVMEV